MPPSPREGAVSKGRGRAVIVAGGRLDFDPTPLIGPADYLVCADSGADLLRPYALAIDLVCGDMDSIDPGHLAALEAAGVEVLRFPVKKDLTDLEIALQKVREEGYEDLLCLAVDGDRLDHQMTNYLMLSAYAQTMDLEVRARDHQVFFLGDHKQKLILRDKKDCLVSLIPLEETTGITYEGMAYPLEGASLFMGSSRGVSNQITRQEASVSIESGRALFIINKPVDRPA